MFGVPVFGVPVSPKEEPPWLSVTPSACRCWIRSGLT